MTRMEIFKAVDALVEYLDELITTENIIELGCPVVANTVKEYKITRIDEESDGMIGIGVCFAFEDSKYWSTKRWYFVKNGKVQ